MLTLSNADYGTGISGNRMRQWQLVYYAGSYTYIPVPERSPIKALKFPLQTCGGNLCFYEC
jgi:hypothetical protein